MSQTKMIYSHLKRYGSITPLTALDKYGCFRLAARINELRDKGVRIETDIIEQGDKHFAKYKLI